MRLRLNPRSGAPLFVQIATSIRNDVREGRIHPGDRLPPGRHLAETLEVNSHTVLRAYQLLRDQGVVELRRGRGATVLAAADPIVGVRDALRNAVALAAGSGITRDVLHSELIALCRQKGLPR
ncbi:GntR family transcriptional regulator [Rhodococcus sp. WS4]|nr:GntR family transcriptional regulator [Rhodococcus sp. WS4]